MTDSLTGTTFCLVEVLDRVPQPQKKRKSGDVRSRLYSKACCLGNRFDHWESLFLVFFGVESLDFAALALHADMSEMNAGDMPWKGVTA